MTLRCSPSSRVLVLDSSCAHGDYVYTISNSISLQIVYKYVSDSRSTSRTCKALSQVMTTCADKLELRMKPLNHIFPLTHERHQCHVFRETLMPPTLSSYLEPSYEHSSFSPTYACFMSGQMELHHSLFDHQRHFQAWHDVEGMSIKPQSGLVLL
jgi:hypothetical protein